MSGRQKAEVGLILWTLGALLLACGVAWFLENVLSEERAARLERWLFGGDRDERGEASGEALFVLVVTFVVAVLGAIIADARLDSLEDHREHDAARIVELQQVVRKVCTIEASLLPEECEVDGVPEVEEVRP